MKLCKCGCKQEVDEIHDYKFGHNLLTEECKNKKKQSLHDPNFVKMNKNPLSNHLCKCGCGQPVKYKYAFYVKGHHNINKPARNKGMHWKIRDDCPKKINGFSEQHIANLKIAMTGENNGFYGKKHKTETIEAMKDKLRVMMTGEGNAFYGKHSFTP